MLAVCALIALVGLAVSIGGRLGPGNPFGIFFALWLAMTVGLLATGESFFPVAGTFWFMLAVILGAYLAVEVVAVTNKIPLSAPLGTDLEYRNGWVTLGQWASVACLPLIYLHANQLAGDDIFSAQGYMALRQALTEGGEGYGPLGYIVPLGFVVASIRLMQFAQTRRGFWNMAASGITGLAMAYLCTGRTFFLMLFCFLIFPLIVTGKVKLRGLVIAGVLLVVSFLMVAFMTRKGLNPDVSTAENIEGLLNMLRIYVLSPTMAMSALAEGNHEPLALGGYSLRFFQIILEKTIGWDFDPVPLIRDYVQVPDEVNVFTVMDPYFRDFGFGGVVGFALLSSIMHFTLYRWAQRCGGPWIFFYSATLFALVMQFFQDMYASLLSTWIQVFFWYMLLVVQQRRPAIKTSSAYA